MPFILYNSSAGSGKTFSLVVEYLTIILKDTHMFKRVLAITFTNKAASEMKDRIIAALESLSKGQMPHMADAIRKNSKNTLTDQEIETNSKGVLKKILHNYSDFAIMTIDSFIFKIVSTFALELNLPINFDVDLNTKQIVKKTVHAMIQEASENSYTGDIIKEFILSKMDQSESWNYESDIETVGTEIFSEKSFDYLSELAGIDDPIFLQILNRLKERKFAFQNRLRALSRQAMDAIDSAGLEIDEFKYKKSGIAGTFLKLASATKAEDFELGKRFRDGKSTDWVSDKSDRKEQIESLRDSVLEGLRLEILDYHSRHIRTYLSVSAVLRSFPLIALIRKLNIYIDAYKKENNIVPISDFNRIVSRIIHREIIPFIYWRVGDRFENYLLDEFQDTSTLQLDNLFPLFENAYSSGFTTIAVGDPKQSIYRWRGSDAAIMGSRIQSLVDHEFLEQRKLGNNYRSSRQIIEFNNRFFTQVHRLFDAKEEMASNIYHEDNLLQASVTNSPPGGYVEIYASQVKYNASDFMNLAIDNTVGTIQSLLAEGYHYKDISILTRTNQEGNTIAEALFKQDIQVISPDSLFLNNAPEVRFIISTLKFIMTSEEIFLHEMATYIYRAHYSTICAETMDRKLTAQLKEQVPDFFKQIQFFQKSSIYETVESIIRIFRLQDKNSGYIQGFLETVYKVSAHQHRDIHSFLSFWEEKKETDECALLIPAGIDAVSIMTIHKSKGLEFPIVLIPLADWEIVPRNTGFKKNRFWVREQGEIIENRIPYFIELNRDLENTVFSKQYNEEKRKAFLDNLNLLYVAFTRAVERLYVLINSGKGKSISEVIETCMKQMEIEIDNQYYRFGDRLKPVVGQQKLPETQISLHSFFSESWSTKVLIRENTKGIWDSDQSDRTHEVLARLERGKLIHLLLSRVRLRSDVKRVLDEFQFAGYLSESERSTLEAKLEALMNLPFEDGTFSDLFDDRWRIYCEQNFLFRGSTIKPDRVVSDRTRTIILDYKSGKPDPKDIDQVQNYCDALSEMDERQVSAYIVYISENRLQQVH